jgi:trans-aconitate 2-methyltransferase
MAGTAHEWDAVTYQRISVPHEEWAEAVLARLPLQGTETVLDAGCGTGRVTRMLVERLPEGRVVAVDGSAPMVEQVRSVLREGDQAFVADLTELKLEQPVDAIVSSAVFHWIRDHDQLFRRMRGCLRPGGRLAAQCGGAGNIDEFRMISGELAVTEPFAAHLADFEEPWFYATPEETEARLAVAGFEQARCWLQPWDVVPPDPVDFMRTLILAPHLDHLPEELRDPFLAATMEAMGEPLRLRYVRLNIDAIAA